MKRTGNRKRGRWHNLPLALLLLGGMHEWRANTAEVTVGPGRVDAIRLVESAELEVDDPEYAAVALEQAHG